MILVHNNKKDRHNRKRQNQQSPSQDPALRESMAAILSRSPFFASVASDTLEKVLDLCTLRDYQAHEVVYRAGERAEHLFVIAKGGVRLELPSTGDTHQAIGVFHQADGVGVACTLRMGRYLGNAICSEKGTQLIAIETQGFKELLKVDLGLLRAVVAGLCEQNFDLVRRVNQLTGDAATRIARHVLTQPSIPSGPSGTGIGMNINGTKQELANLLDITPETLSRVLRRWKNRNLVEISGREITVLDLEGLEAEAAGNHASRN